MQAADFHALYAFTASAPIASSTAHQSELMHSRSQLRCDTGGEATREAVAVLRWKSTAWLTPDPTTASEVVLELTGGDGPGMVAHEGDLAVALVGRAGSTSCSLDLRPRGGGSCGRRVARSRRRGLRGGLGLGLGL